MTKKMLFILLSIPEIVLASTMGTFLKNGDFVRKGPLLDMAGSFVAVQNATLLGIQGPLKIDSKANVLCQVPRGTQISKENAVTISYKFGVYSMNRDMDIDVYKDGLLLIPVRKGEIIEDLGYIRQSMCHVRVGARVYISECFKRFVESRAATMISDLIQHDWYQVPCKDGKVVRVRYPVLADSFFLKEIN